MNKALVWLACLPLLGACAAVPPVPADVMNDLAPAGNLRAAINFGNTVLAQKDPASGEPRGVSVDLARELGRRLGVPVELVTFDAAGKVFDALGADAWDVAFLAIEPVRAAQVSFTAPYVVIEGTYLVPVNSPLRAIGDFDRDGIRIAVGNKSAYDLYLSRTLKHAQLVRAPTSPAAIELFVRDRLEAAAGVKQPLVQYAQSNPGVRVIDGRFMAIEQAMGMPRGRAAGARYLGQFVEEMKASGFVARALQRSGQGDAVVAPPAPSGSRAG
jgi:polar amino acid transport system substrate-binding protein